MLLLRVGQEILTKKKQVSQETLTKTLLQPKKPSIKQEKAIWCF
jgi:hypothetical protein